MPAVAVESQPLAPDAVAVVVAAPTVVDDNPYTYQPEGGDSGASIGETLPRPIAVVVGDVDSPATGGGAAADGGVAITAADDFVVKTDGVDGLGVQFHTLSDGDTAEGARSVAGSLDDDPPEDVAAGQKARGGYKAVRTLVSVARACTECEMHRGALL